MTLLAGAAWQPAGQQQERYAQQGEAQSKARSPGIMHGGGAPCAGGYGGQCGKQPKSRAEAKCGQTNPDGGGAAEGGGTGHGGWREGDGRIWWT